MQKRIIALLLVGSIATCSLAGCNFNKNKEINEESKDIVEKQQSLTKYEGTITYYIDSEIAFSILDEKNKPDLDVTTNVSNVAKVQNNEARYISTESETSADSQKDKSKTETWFSSKTGKKYKKDYSNNNGETWQMMDMEESDKTTCALPDSLNGNENLGTVIAQSLSNTNIKEKDDTLKADISIPVSDLADSGITTALFMRATPFGDDLPEDDDINPDGNVKGSVTFSADKQFTDADLEFDNVAYVYMNAKYKDFGLQINNISVHIKAEYDPDTSLEIPKDVTDHAVISSIESNETEEILDDTESEDVIRESEQQISADKNTLAKKYLGKQSITVDDLIDLAGVNSDWTDNRAELTLTDGLAAYVSYSDVLQRFADLLSHYDEDDILSAFDVIPQPSEDDSMNNTYPYAVDFLALDVLSQTGLLSDQISEKISSVTFDTYDLFDFDTLEECVSHDFSDLIAAFQ